MRCVGLVSALSVGLFSVISDPSAKSKSMAGANSCPEPAVVVQNDAVGFAVGARSQFATDLCSSL